MTTQHTQGRLHVAGQDKAQIRSDKHQIAKAWSFAGKTGQENARRLVACWNACEGISTEALERLGTLDRARVELDVLRTQAVTQRNELLAALKAASNYINVLGGDSKSYRQTIAKVERSSDAPT